MNVLRVTSLFTEYASEHGAVVKAAQNVSFEVPEGKLFTLLGPSGCGKTTTLRSIAGLEKPTAGEIEVAGRLVYSSDKGIFVAPNKRNFGMVFQSYAIWPQMNVFQTEALALSHEIAVMNEGRVVQVGTPRQIYEQPTDQFVADFVGTTNFIGGTVTALGDGRCVVSSAVGELKAHASEGVSKNATVIVSVRPEDVELSEQPPTAADGDNVCKGTVDAKDFLGDYLDFHVKVGDVVLLAKAHPSLRTPTGDPIYLRMKADKCVAISRQ